MAEKRMFAKSVITKGQFLRLSNAAKVLYISLSMDADDDGFVEDSYASTELTHTGEAELLELIERRFIIRFDSGVIVIRHWNINNTLKKDRYHPTRFVRERQMTTVNQNNEIDLLDTNRIQDVSSMETEQVKPSPVKPSPVKPSRDQVGEHREGGNVEPEWKDVLKAASDKGVSVSSYQVITRLNELKGKTSCAALIDRINTDEEFIDQLKRLR